MLAIISSHLTNAGRTGQFSKKFTSHPGNFSLRVKRSLVAFAIVACWIAGSLTSGAVQSVTLAWDRSPDATAVGYRIYARAENVTIPTSYNVLGLTQVTVPGLREGLRYTFTVTSYNAAGTESAPSNAAEFVVPVPLRLLPGTTATDPKRLQFPAAPGHWYEIQASTNMKTWDTVLQTSVASSYGWTEFQEPAVSGSGGGTAGGGTGSKLPCRFFRLKVH